MLARKIEQHDAEQNRQQTLTGHAWKRKDDADRHQQQSTDILAYDAGGVKQRTWSRPEFRLARLAEMVCGNLDENERNDGQVNEKRTNKDQRPDQEPAPRHR